jgi:hypothetical protein
MTSLCLPFSGGRAFGKMWLFFGCRQRALDLYCEEKSTMLEEGVLDKVFLALSREPTIPKVMSFVNRYAKVSMRHTLLYLYIIYSSWA